jgi:23S rRNA (cytosine1962-C5)-methyltransferase
MNNKIISVILKPGRESSVKRYHPWIFSGAIKKNTGSPAEGDVVDVFSNAGEYLATGHYQIGSIAIRIFSFHQVAPDYEFWKSKLLSAYRLRTLLNLTDNPETNVYRLVNGEGDGFPGLIIDFYNGTVVFQMHSIGMYLIREELAEIIKEIYGNKLKAIYDKSETTIPYKSGIVPINEYLTGTTNSEGVSEYGNKFSVDWQEGQKTGFFIDQRENRKLLERYSKDKNVLNMFCYTGGFSVYALRGGARLVHSVDSSEKAIQLTNENIALNFDDTRHESFTADAFTYLKDLKTKYDLIVLDPPAFAKHQNVLQNALQAYKRLNAAAIAHIKAGGVLFTFSCSQVVSKENFRRSVFTAAANTGRKVSILHQLTQPADHPVDIYHPEGEYLKGLVVYVE